MARILPPPTSKPLDPAQRPKDDWTALAPIAAPPPPEPAPSPKADAASTDAKTETAKEADSDAANAGIRREPELGEHEEIVPPTKAPEKEFDFDDNDPGDDAARDRRQIDRSMARNARNASLDPDDGIDL